MLDMGPYYITDAGESARAGRAGAGHDRPRTRRAHDRQRAAGRADRSRSRWRRTSPARCDFASRRGGQHRDELRRAAAPARADRALRHRGDAARARSEPLRRPIEIGRDDKSWSERPRRARLCRRQLPHHRRGRHGACDPRGPSASRSGELAYHVLEVMEAFRTSSERGRTSRSRAAPHAPGCCRPMPGAASRLDAGLLERRHAPSDSWLTLSTSVEEQMTQALIVWGGWRGHEPEQCARNRARHARGGRLQGARREHDRGVRRSGDSPSSA